mmetsp:Transcript_15001/g.30132  ORF Transcript_15001/g.30132 Transcript_15001/m.30132 type:complete len:344 (+) Transcript_15001:256-1287(+)
MLYKRLHGEFGDVVGVHGPVRSHGACYEAFHEAGCGGAEGARGLGQGLEQKVEVLDHGRVLGPVHRLKADERQPGGRGDEALEREPLGGAAVLEHLHSQVHVCHVHQPPSPQEPERGEARLAQTVAERGPHAADAADGLVQDDGEVGGAVGEAHDEVQLQHLELRRSKRGQPPPGTARTAAAQAVAVNAAACVGGPEEEERGGECLEGVAVAEEAPVLVVRVAHLTNGLDEKEQGQDAPVRAQQLLLRAAPLPKAHRGGQHAKGEEEDQLPLLAVELPREEVPGKSLAEVHEDGVAREARGVPHAQPRGDEQQREVQGEAVQLHVHCRTDRAEVQVGRPTPRG